jgi:hypothetical protein
MRLVAFVVAVSLAFTVGLSTLDACKLPPRVSPELSTIATPDAQYILAVVEPIERFRQFQPNDDEKAILERYPVSGVYRVGAAPELMWELEDWYNPPAIHSFFNNADGVHWVVGDPGGLRFYSNGDLVREVNRLELFSAPWRAGEASCVGPRDLDVKVSSTGRQPEITVTTDEGSRFVFAAESGVLVSERRKAALARVTPSVEEEQLVALISDFTALARSAQLGALSYEEARRFEPISLYDCSPENNDAAEIAEMANQQIEPDSQGAIWLTPWRAERAMDMDVLGLARIRLSQDRPFALYRVPEGEAVQTLCGMEPLLANLLAASLARVPAHQSDEYLPLAEALNGPTVLAATAGVWEENGERHFIGLATVWRHVNGEWRILGFQFFELPPEGGLEE